LPKDDAGHDIDTRSHTVAPGAVRHIEDHKLFVHYSIGVPPELLPEALARVTGASRKLSGDKPIVDGGGGKEINQAANFASEHAAAAPRVAARIAARFATALTDPQRNEFTGQIALVFTHMAAFANIVAAQNAGYKGQPKNYILALSRASLRSVFDTLSPATRDALRTNHAEIYEELGRGVDEVPLAEMLARNELPGEQILPNFADDDRHRVQAGMPWTRLKHYALSGLGAHAAIAQQDVFGGMKQVAPDPSVVGGRTTQGRGVVLELRSLGNQRTTFDEMTTTLADLLTWSRTAILGHD
jgi:hypothetical protein